MFCKSIYLKVINGPGQNPAKIRSHETEGNNM